MHILSTCISWKNGRAGAASAKAPHSVDGTALQEMYAFDGLSVESSPPVYISCKAVPSKSQGVLSQTPPPP